MKVWKRELLSQPKLWPGGSLQKSDYEDTENVGEELTQMKTLFLKEILCKNVSMFVFF